MCHLILSQCHTSAFPSSEILQLEFNYVILYIHSAYKDDYVNYQPIDIICSQIDREISIMFYYYRNYI